MKNYTQRRLEVGDNVVICDSINTGLIGTVGGYKGTSVAVCMKENTGHDCEGLCPSGGTYESEYALLPFKEEDRKSLGLLLNHIHKPTSITQALAEERKRVDKEITKQFKYASENDNYDMRGVDWQSIIHPSDKLPDNNKDI